MTKALLLVCILLSLGAAVLGYLNRDELLRTRDNLQNTQTTLDNTNNRLKTTEGELEEKKQEVTKLGSEKDQVTAQLGEARTEIDKTKQELAAAQEQVTAAQTEIEQLKQENQEQADKIAQMSTNAPPTTPEGVPSDVETASLQAKLTESEMIRQQLQDQNTSLSTQIAELRRKEEGRQKLQMRQGLTGTILAVNQAWNFVVLSLGDRQGVVPNAEMLIQRDGQYLGKVRVTSVEPSTSIADILVRTVPRGLSVMPGDKVIYQALRD